ncbi:MobC family plasmid mobilization relaxosome protein [Pseudoalteromonas sp. 120-MNA-CIBAN-0494]|jgi:hypothetical protein|uniref:MobC family plasmid mobilization relaxosome protein n=2 Tax=Pseudoalteromonas TaxID=53246 RepID=UPI0033317354
MTDEKRTKSIKIRVNESEFSALKSQKEKAGFSMLADYMRSVSLNLEVSVKKEYPKVDPVLQRQLSGIGNNINQIARQVNSSEIKAGDSLQIISYLSSIDENLKQIRQSWSVQK